jgi:hypothetical protein
VFRKLKREGKKERKKERREEKPEENRSSPPPDRPKIGKYTESPVLPVSTQGESEGDTFFLAAGI